MRGRLEKIISISRSSPSSEQLMIKMLTELNQFYNYHKIVIDQGTI